ncbi:MULTISPECIES: mandelate racemase/muconate lactonizing enzyme family protein [Natrialbaceae]|uniref:mandelate racemase/muconate lactonizing enzyme family protein n=1 Tax=Natrialbaceae TaxID=1644061 RepID=UPI003606A5DC
MSVSEITNISTGLYGIPNEEALKDATQTFDELELVTVTIETSAGERGVGLTYTIGEGGTSIKQFLDDVLVPKLAGESAAPESIRTKLRSETTFIGREGISELALSAIDIALWDIVGKEAGKPLYDILGGDQTLVPAYETNGGWIQFDIETLQENAAEIADNGFSGMKMKIGRGYAEDAERIRAVYNVLPEDVDLFVDANCAFSVAEARRFASHIGDIDLAWLEEPLEKGDYDAYADLRTQIDIPIAVGENFYNETQFKQVMARKGADFLQPDVSRVGGITPWMTVARAASLWNIPVSPHYIEPIHVHLATAVDNVPYIEHHSTVLNRVVEEPLTVENGGLVPPDRPGHGLVFDGLDQFEKSG